MFINVGEEKITLPSVNGVPAILGTDAKFLGWQLNGTRTNYNPGDVVDANRRAYNAIFETASSFESHDYTYSSIPYNYRASGFFQSRRHRRQDTR